MSAGEPPSRTSLPCSAAVVAAGGQGLRLGTPVRKQFIQIGGKSILRYTLDLFLSLEEISRFQQNTFR